MADSNKVTMLISDTLLFLNSVISNKDAECNVSHDNDVVNNDSDFNAPIGADMAVIIPGSSSESQRVPKVSISTPDLPPTVGIMGTVELVKNISSSSEQQNILNTVSDDLNIACDNDCDLVPENVVTDDSPIDVNTVAIQMMTPNVDSLLVGSHSIANTPKSGQILEEPRSRSKRTSLRSTSAFKSPPKNPQGRPRKHPIPGSK